MTEQAGGPIESIMEKISEKIHAHDSSTDSETEAENKESARAKIYRLFGRERPVHEVLGGGKPADVMLWKNKKASAGAVGLATAIWVLFELAEYHLLTLVCHILIVSLAVLFLWSNARTLVNKSPPRIPEVHLPEDIFRDVASVLTMEINQAFAFLRDVATGKDLKKFLIVIASLWVLSIVGSWCNFLTLFYILFVLLHTIPFIYDKYEDKVDPFADKAMFEIKKQYAVFDVKVLSKIPVGGLKAKRV